MVSRFLTIALVIHGASAPLAYAEDTARYGFLIAKPSSPFDRFLGALAPALPAACLQQSTQLQLSLPDNDANEPSFLAHLFRLDFDSNTHVNHYHSHHHPHHKHADGAYNLVLRTACCPNLASHEPHAHVVGSPCHFKGLSSNVSPPFDIESYTLMDPYHPTYDVCAGGNFYSLRLAPYRRHVAPYGSHAYAVTLPLCSNGLAFNRSHELKSIHGTNSAAPHSDRALHSTNTIRCVWNATCIPHGPGFSGSPCNHNLHCHHMMDLLRPLAPSVMDLLLCPRAPSAAAVLSTSLIAALHIMRPSTSYTERHGCRSGNHAASLHFVCLAAVSTRHLVDSILCLAGQARTTPMSRAPSAATVGAPPNCVWSTTQGAVPFLSLHVMDLRL